MTDQILLDEYNGHKLYKSNDGKRTVIYIPLDGELLPVRVPNDINKAMQALLWSRANVEYSDSPQ